MKARGHRSSPGTMIWFKEKREEDIAAERSWFRVQGLPLFRTAEVTSFERHR